MDTRQLIWERKEGGHIVDVVMHGWIERDVCGNEIFIDIECVCCGQYLVNRRKPISNFIL